MPDKRLLPFGPFVAVITASILSLAPATRAWADVPAGSGPLVDSQIDATRLTDSDLTQPAPVKLTADKPDAGPVSTNNQVDADNPDPKQLAQAIQAQDQPMPTDLTPVRLPERGSAFTTYDSLKSAVLYRLPAKMFFSVLCDNSLRLETNVFQTLNHNQPDMVYRVFPNLTVGYALTPRTRVSSNLFFFRDQYTTRGILDRNTYSVGGRIDHDIPIGEKNTLSLGFFARELLFNLKKFNQEPLCDLIPSAVLSRRIGYASLIYAAVLGQIRFVDMVGGRFQEGDQFYSFGGVWRKSPWTFVTDLTLDSNFGNKNLRHGHNNQVIIITLEAARRLSRRIPLAAFVQAQPIFNMGANSSPGFAGFNFRLFGGLRMEFSKPAIFPVRLASK